MERNVKNTIRERIKTNTNFHHTGISLVAKLVSSSSSQKRLRTTRLRLGTYEEGKRTRSLTILIKNHINQEKRYCVHTHTHTHTHSFREMPYILFSYYCYYDATLTIFNTDSISFGRRTSKTSICLLYPHFYLRIYATWKHLETRNKLRSAHQEEWERRDRVSSLGESSRRKKSWFLSDYVNSSLRSVRCTNRYWKIDTEKCNAGQIFKASCSTSGAGRGRRDYEQNHTPVSSDSTAQS